MMRLFCGEWVEGVLKRLGMTEGKSIESKMVSRRIKEAQEKLGVKCFHDYPADSAQEWLERNFSK
jgi:preprotein translocase subunit SecA